MKRVLYSLIFCIVTTISVASSLPSQGEFEATPNDESSNALQNQIDKETISPDTANSDIENGDFDSSKGGLYCPNNNCEADPSDVANGF